MDHEMMLEYLYNEARAASARRARLSWVALTLLVGGLVVLLGYFALAELRVVKP
jgi:hypothetical protein